MGEKGGGGGVWSLWGSAVAKLDLVCSIHASLGSYSRQCFVLLQLTSIRGF